MTKSGRHGRSRLRAAIAVLAVLALLFQSAFVIACDVHDLGHDISTATVDADADTPADADSPDSGRWHDVFAVGHGIAQVFETAATLDIPALALPDGQPLSPVRKPIPPEPFSAPLRPPIVA